MSRFDDLKGQQAKRSVSLFADLKGPLSAEFERELREEELDDLEIYGARPKSLIKGQIGRWYGIPMIGGTTSSKYTAF